MSLLIHLHNAISQHAAEIETLFKEDVNVTICVRNANREQANILVTNDAEIEMVVTKEFLDTLPIEIGRNS